MADPHFIFWTRWLFWANVMAVGVGILCAFFGNSWVFGFHNTGTQVVFFKGIPYTPEVLQLKNWLFGIIGGTIVGFHVLMLFIIHYAFRQQQTWAYMALWAGLLSWFVIDSGITAYYGAWHNLFGINLVALILIGLPLLATKNYFDLPKAQ